MEFKITHPDKKTTILEKVTLVLFGVFVNSSIFAITIKAWQETGMWLGLAINLLLIFCGFYYIKKTSKLRIVTWGIFGTLILAIALLVTSIGFISTSLGGL